jgi:RimJ/RimL family protein N-acetyltransferase
MFLRTQRLFLRPAWPEDARELTRAIGQEAVVRMLARAPWPYREEHARTWIDSPRDPSLPNLLITLPDEDGRIVGCVGLHEDGGQVEVGYWVAPTHWGRGYATEALSGLVALARLAGHRRIVSRHAADNPASGRVLKKAGFRQTGRAQPFRSLGRDTGMLAAPENALELDDPLPMKRDGSDAPLYSAGVIAA